jgi:hypothetical protein
VNLPAAHIPLGDFNFIAELFVRQLEIDPADMQFTEAVRSRTGSEVPTCPICQEYFSPSQFPPGD